MKLIKISDSHYIVVDDSEIKAYPTWGDETCFVLHLPSKSILMCNGIGEMNGSKTIIYAEFMYGREVLYKECKKITYSTESMYENKIMRNGVIDSIKTISLSEVDEAIYGYNVEKLALKYNPVQKLDVEFIRAGFIAGFRKHQELVKDKLFTINDMTNAFREGTNSGALYESLIEDDSEEAEKFSEKEFSDFKKSLLPKIEWDVKEITPEGKIILL